MSDNALTKRRRGMVRKSGDSNPFLWELNRRNDTCPDYRLRQPSGPKPPEIAPVGTIIQPEFYTGCEDLGMSCQKTGPYVITKWWRTEFQGHEIWSCQMEKDGRDGFGINSLVAVDGVLMDLFRRKYPRFESKYHLQGVKPGIQRSLFG